MQATTINVDPQHSSHEISEATHSALKHPMSPMPAAFASAYNDYQLQHYRPVLLLVLVLSQAAYFLYGFVDLLVTPDIGPVSIAVRSLFMLITLPLGWQINRRSGNMTLIDSVVPLLIVIAAAIWFTLLAHSASPNISTYKYASLVFIMLSNLCVQHAFVPALAISALISSVIIGGVWMIERDHPMQLLTFLLVYLPILFFSLFSSWSTTVSRRRAFLHQLEEQQLRRQYARFSALISHEFRNPLAVISAQASMLRKTPASQSDEVLRRLDVITKSSHRIVLLLDRWMRHDRIEQRLVRLRLESFDLTRWLQQTSVDNELLLDRRIAVPPSSPVMPLTTDRELLETALFNLIENAAKYSPADSEIIIETRRREGYFGIAVTDRGAGIPEAQMPKMFDAYVRMQPEGGPAGLGLGLTLVRKIIHALGGKIDVSSVPGQGSTFCLWLPVAAEQDHRNIHECYRQ